MATRRHERTAARAHALQLLYGCEVRGIGSSELVAEGGYFVSGEPVSPYGCYLLEGVEAHREELDGFLASTSDNWSIGRMPIVDRSILRLAAFEMIYSDDVPVSVAINEAVELARRFGGEDESPRFVNGVLGRIAEKLEQRAAKAAEAELAADLAAVEADDAAAAGAAGADDVAAVAEADAAVAAEADAADEAADERAAEEADAADEEAADES